MCEAREENERLIYVAMTRARAKVYLPVYPDGSTKVPVSGYYEALNERLKVLVAEIDRGAIATNLMEQVTVRDRATIRRASLRELDREIASWVAPPVDRRAGERREIPRFFEEIRFRSRPMQTRSYTSLESRRRARETRWRLDIEEFKYDLEAPVEGADLKGGRRIGIFLHEVIEKLDLESFDLAREVGVLEATRSRQAGLCRRDAPASGD